MKCSDILAQEDNSEVDNERVRYLCENAEFYPADNSVQNHKNFFSIGNDIPPLEYASEITVQSEISENDHITEEEPEKEEEQDEENSSESVILEAGGSDIVRIVLISLGGIIVLTTILCGCCCAYRNCQKENIQKTIGYEQEKAKPVNIIKDELR